MASQGKSSKQGRNKGSASMIAYAAQNRLAKNKARRIKRHGGTTPKGTPQAHYVPSRTKAAEREMFTRLQFYGERF